MVKKYIRKKKRKKLTSLPKNPVLNSSNNSETQETINKDEISDKLIKSNDNIIIDCLTEEENIISDKILDSENSLKIRCEKCKKIYIIK